METCFQNLKIINRTTKIKFLLVCSLFFQYFNTLSQTCPRSVDILQADTQICKGSVVKLSVDSSFTAINICSLNQLPSNLQNGLVAFYPFCCNANDISGNNNNGTISGSVSCTTDRFNNINSALFFPGNTNSFISIPPSSSLSSNTQSWAFWVKFNTDSPLPGKGIISRSDIGGSCNGSTIYELQGDIQSQLKMCTPDDQIVNTGVGYGYDVWHHIVLLIQPGIGCQFYVDGIPGTLRPLTAIFQFNLANPIRLGRPTDEYWEAFEGSLDDVAIYNRALTANEIIQLYEMKPRVHWSTGDTSYSILVSPIQSTQYFATITDGISTCMDSVTINVEVPIVYDTSLSGCDDVIYQGIPYYASTIKTDTLKSKQGCDSVFRIANITVYKITPISDILNRSRCDSVIYQGTTYYASTIKTDTLKNQNGCDSVYKIKNIVVYNSSKITQRSEISGIDSVSYQGAIYYMSSSMVDTIKSIHGCDSIHKTLYIIVNYSNQLFIPSAFTPNGDGKNDVFKPIVKGIPSQYNLRIYNRWGEAIFQSTDPAKGWDGKYKNKPQILATYIYHLSFQFVGQPLKNEKGTFVLIR